uniref:Contryphan-Bt n=3 Tax=Conus TaxID=6490 RepID=COW1_CONBE|nr:RecName: Full=Contryphan-Ze; AltName: Full=Z1187 [Conus zeylanicus]P0DP19.1 RecName: Full=Contryphan-Bt; AltName: Full=B1187 [Conus betulinus]P0DP20.1 RecName: Full=Contryphan-Fia; AltName: Full=Fi1187 [Conus figulinus]
VVGCPWQPWC